MRKLARAILAGCIVLAALGCAAADSTETPVREIPAAAPPTAEEIEQMAPQDYEEYTRHWRPD
jgi:hypothetical protein